MTKKTMKIETEKDKKDDVTVVREELIKRTPMEDTPFVIITIEGKSFGTFGQYKITEDMPTVRDVEESLALMTWNRLIQIMTLVNQMLNNQKQ